MTFCNKNYVADRRLILTTDLTILVGETLEHHLGIFELVGWLVGW